MTAPSRWDRYPDEDPGWRELLDTIERIGLRHSGPDHDREACKACRTSGHVWHRP